MTDQIASLGVNVGANTAQFDTKMKGVRRTANTTAASVKQSFAGVGRGLAGGLAAGLSVGLLSTGIKAALEYAGSLGEVSQQLGVTTKDLQVFRFAAGQVGVSQEQLETGLQKLTITLGKVAAGAAAPTKALNAIGLSAKDVAGLDAGAAFRKIADGLAPITDRAQRAAVEVALFGKSGANLDNLLSGGSKAINELSAAAEKLGIVLSDRQIQQADDTADKLEAVKTVLAAQVSGVVADNAQSILSLSSSLASLTASIVKFMGSNPMGALAILGALAGSRFGLPGAAAGAFAGATAGASMKAWQTPAPDQKFLKQRFLDEASRLKQMRAAGQPFGDQLAKVRRLKQRYDTASGIPAPVALGANVTPFLASGGGGSKAKGRDTSKDAERARLDALRDAHRFDEDSRRADMDILQAKQALAPTYVERSALEIEMLNLEQVGYQAELDNQVAMGEMSKAQADQLMAKYKIADTLKRQAVLTDEEEQRQRTYNALDDKDYEIKQDILQKQAGLAKTAGERRALELEILQLEYDHRKMVLERIMRESKDYAEIEGARRELANLGANQALDRKGVMQSTQGPMEQYFSDMPQTAAQAQEAMEALKVQGIDGAINSIIALQDGFGSMRDAAVSAIKQIIAELIRMQLMKMAMNIIGTAAGAPPGMPMGTSSPFSGSAGAGVNFMPGGTPGLGFATGGSFNVMGNHGRDRNVMSINGLPIAKVSHGERVSVSNDNPMQGGGGFTFNNYARMSADEARRTGMQAAAGYRAEMNRATRKGF